MDNRALIRAEGFLKDALQAIDIQQSKLRDEPSTPEELLDDLRRIADTLVEIEVMLLKAINRTEG